MSPEECISALGGWKGYDVSRVEIREADQSVIVHLTPCPGACQLCEQCREPGFLIHDQRWRTVRDLPAFERAVHLRFPRRRLWCGHCGGPQQVHIPWLEPYARVTQRFAEWVVRLADVMPIKHVADLLGLHWSTVQHLHLAHLERTLGPPNLDGVRALAMDEFAIQKGHRYATVIADADTRRVLWVGRGWSRAEIRPFFQLLGTERAQNIEVAVMDMNSAYDLEVQAHCPNAKIVYDKFHVLAKYNREVVDRVRVDRANELRRDRPQRQVVKRSKWLLLKRRDRLRPDQRVRLDEVLEANAPLATADIMRDELRELWELCQADDAGREWQDWIQKALESGVKPLMQFARKLRPYLPGLVNYHRWNLTTGFLEGFNNAIKVLKRRAYGYRNDDYFFMRIRAAFPGYQPRSPNFPR